MRKYNIYIAIPSNKSDVIINFFDNIKKGLNTLEDSERIFEQFTFVGNFQRFSSESINTIEQLCDELKLKRIFDFNDRVYRDNNGFVKFNKLQFDLLELVPASEDSYVLRVDDDLTIKNPEKFAREVIECCDKLYNCDEIGEYVFTFSQKYDGEEHIIRYFNHYSTNSGILFRWHNRIFLDFGRGLNLYDALGSSEDVALGLFHLIQGKIGIRKFSNASKRKYRDTSTFNPNYYYENGKVLLGMSNSTHSILCDYLGIPRRNLDTFKLNSESANEFFNSSVVNMSEMRDDIKELLKVEDTEKDSKFLEDFYLSKISDRSITQKI